MLTVLLTVQNIRIIAKYYTEMSLQRMAQLLDWDVAVSHTLYCMLIDI